MNAHVIQCKIGDTAPELIRDSETRFYKWLIANVTHSREEFINVPPQRTIPITNEDVQSGGAEAYAQVLHVLENIEIINPEDVLIVNIDVRKTSHLRAHVFLHIFSAVNTKLKSLKESLPSKCIIILEDLPPVTDNHYWLIESIGNTLDLLIFDEDGYCSREVSINRFEFISKRILSKQDPRTAIKKKMVRHFGHFQKETPTGTTCIRHFYDGQYCISDIADYLFVELQPIVNDKTAICYHSKLSPFLVDSIMSLHNKINCVFYDISVGNMPPSDMDVYLILDFIDTGNTLISVVDKFSCDPKRIIAILATDNDGANTGKRRILRTEKDFLEVDYILKAEFEKLGPSPCELCNIGLPVDTLPNLSMSGQLRSVDFWEMVFGSKLTQESDPPDYRAALTLGIDSCKLINKNAGFIASRVVQLFEECKCGIDTSIICPADEKGSGEFALSLELMMSKNVIAIPRKTINRFVSPGANFLRDELSSEWYIKLSTPTVNECVVIDDVSVSGRTLIGITKIINKINKKINLVIPLLNLNPDIRENISANLIPLYEWKGAIS